MPKKILITGATSGIGTYLSQHFASKGFTLFLHGRDEKKLDNLAKKLQGADVTLLHADYRHPKSIEKMFEKLKTRTKNLDILVNNAFGKLEDELVKTDGQSLSEFFQVSVAGTADVIRQCLPLLKQSKTSHVINIVADWGFPMHNVMTGPSAYISAKYAVHGLGAALQTEIAKLGIMTTNLCPGVMAAGTEFGSDPMKFTKANGKKAIHPMDLANAIEFVIGQRFSHVRTIVLTPPDPEYNGL